MCNIYNLKYIQFYIYILNIKKHVLMFIIYGIYSTLKPFFSSMLTEP